MAIKNLFRISLFGGFNKKEVETYVKTMEEELMRLNDAQKNSPVEAGSGNRSDFLQKEEQLIKELEAAKAQIQNLELQMEQAAVSKVTEEKAQNTDKDRELIARVLEDAYYNADYIVNDANKKADEIIKKAEQTAKEKHNEGVKKLQTELQQRAIDFITMRYRISDYTKQIEVMRQELEEMKNNMQKIAEEIPTKIQSMIGELENEWLIESEYKEKEMPVKPDSEKQEEQEKEKEQK